jgi:4-alpha-glucanotransferase
VVYAFLSKTPSALLGVALDDLGGELEAVNLPGVPEKQKKSWTRRLRMKLEDFVTNSDVRMVLDALTERME